MVRSMTAAVSGLRAHQTKLDVIGNNIANVNTAGYKSARVVFRDAMYQTLSGSSAASGLYAGTNSKQVGYGANVGSISSIWVPGAYYPTDYPTDVMIDGDGFFIVGPKGGPYDTNDIDSLSLTRVGAFELIDGYLVDANGNYVYGFANTAAAGADPTYNYNKVAPIEVPKDASGDPIALKSIQVGKNGTVSGTDDDGNTITLGQIAIASVPNAGGLESTSNSYYSAGANAGNIVAHAPGSGATGQLMAGGLEMSTVDLSKEFTDMITTQRGFQANSRIITVTDDMLQELVNLKR